MNHIKTHTDDADYISLLKIAKEPGVIDLPMAQRGPFARAIRAERIAGETTDKAAADLDKAIAAV